MPRMTRKQLEEMGVDVDALTNDDDGRASEPPAPAGDESEEGATSLYFVVPGRPQGKGRPRFDRKSGRVFTPQKTRRYERLVAMEARRAARDGWPCDATYRLGVFAVYPDGRHADVSNILKAIEDGAEGVLWDNDRQIKSAHTAVEVRPDEEPRVEVSVSVLEAD